MARFIRSVDHEYFFPNDVRLSHVLCAIIRIRESNKDNSVTKITKNEHEILFDRVYKFPGFLRVLFKINKLDMVEKLDLSKATAQSPEIRMSSSPNVPDNIMSLDTATLFTVESGKVVARTTVKVTLPFLLPKILHGPLRAWTKNKTLQLRKEELMTIPNVKPQFEEEDLMPNIEHNINKELQTLTIP